MKAYRLRFYEDYLTGQVYTALAYEHDPKLYYQQYLHDSGSFPHCAEFPCLWLRVSDQGLLLSDAKTSPRKALWIFLHVLPG